VSSSLLDAARDPLFRVVLRGWILRGPQHLDGLLCVKAWAQQASPPQPWPQRLKPWLEHAAEVLENADTVWLRFAEPLPIACELLGGLLPLRRQGGVLSSAEIDPAPASVAAALKGTMILHLHGQRLGLALSSFSRVDIGTLWDLSAPALLDAVALPLQRAAPHGSKGLKTRSNVPFDPADARAGFDALRQRVEDLPSPGLLHRLNGALRNNIALLKPLLAIAAPLALVLLTAMLVRSTLFTEWAEPGPSAITPSPHPASDWTPLFGTLFWIALLTAFTALAIRKIPPRAPAVPVPAPEPAAASAKRITPAPARPGWLSRAIAWLFRSARRPAASSVLATTASPPTRPPIPRQRRWWDRVGAWLLGTARRPAASSAPATTASAPTRPPIPRERSWWGRVAAWLVWRTPLSRGLIREYEHRLRELDRLFKAGRLEEALKRAIALAGEQRSTEAAYGDMPLSGPAIRARLSLDLSGTQATASLPLSPSDYHHFLQLYRAAAQRALAAGDLENAIFIYAELLDDARGAIDILIKADQLETAARLAQARRLPPGFFIPLWFRAGHKRRALDLAARHEAFAELWKELKVEDPFRAVIGLEWARHLAASGDYARALAVSAEYHKDIPDLRREWIRTALKGPLQGELVARALIVLPWSEEDSDGPHGTFRQLLEVGENGAGERIRLAQALTNPALEKQAGNERFMARLPLIASHLILRLVVDEAEFGHDPSRSAAALRLSEYGSQFALRVDLRRLARVPKPHLAVTRSVELAPSPPLAAIIDAVVLPGQRILIAYRSGLVKLKRFSGNEIWRAQLNGLHGLVPIGIGHSILLIRDDLGERRLSVLETVPLRHRDLGAFPVRHYHPWASPETWLVFSGREALALNVLSLLADESTTRDGEFVRHWAIPMSEGGEPVLFLENPREVHFIYERCDRLVEWWSLQKSSLHISLRYWTNAPQVSDHIYDDSIALDHRQCLWAASSFSATFRTDVTRAEELEMIALAAADPDSLTDIQPVASPDAVHWRTESRGPYDVTFFARLQTSSAPFQVRFCGAQQVNAHPPADEPLTAVFDDLGRLLVIDVKQGTVLMTTEGMS